MSTTETLRLQLETTQEVGITVPSWTLQGHQVKARWMWW